MLLKQGFAIVVVYRLPRFFMTSPADLYVSKAGAAFTGPDVGAAVSIAAGGTDEFFATSYTIGNTDTEGCLMPIIYDGANSWSPDAAEQVLPYLPGEVEPAHRLLIAGDTWGLVDGIELGLTPQNALRVAFAVLAGKDAIALDVVTFRNFGDTKTRVAATVDPASKTRLAVTYDFS